ncbi:MAG: hypothetical protein E5X64_16580 [Mesorhizobium sp.]|nr:MAG: hypothetical protein E5X64_16580 [Mesorhizobium sp.]
MIVLVSGWPPNPGGIAGNAVDRGADAVLSERPGEDLVLARSGLIVGEIRADPIWRVTRMKLDFM